MIVWLPTGNVDVFNMAMPPERATLPRSLPVVVSKKSTLPVGVPDPELAVTVAVKVKACPKLEGVAEDVRVVVVMTLTASRPGRTRRCSRRGRSPWR